LLALASQRRSPPRECSSIRPSRIDASSMFASR
jgi:hypothetical protein